MKILKIFGDIVSNQGCKNTPDDICLSDVKSFLDTLEPNEPFEVQICSCGGDVYQGIGIYNLIKEASKTHPCKTHIISLAASIASVIACAGDMVIDSNSYLMIHLPFSCGFSGNALEMEKEIKNLNQIKETLISIYQTKFDLSFSELENLMIAETWIDSTMISDYKINALVNDVEEYKIAASLKKNYMKFNNLPLNIKDLIKMEEKELEEETTVEDTKEAVEDKEVEEEKKEEVEEVETTEEIKETVDDTETVEEEEKKEETTAEENNEAVEEEKKEDLKEEDDKPENADEEETSKQAKLISSYENKILNFTKEIKAKDEEINNLKNEIVNINNRLSLLNGAVNKLSTPMKNAVDWKQLKGKEFFDYLSKHPEIAKG